MTPLINWGGNSIGISKQVLLAPVITSATVENANDNDWIIVLSKVVTTTSAGWTLKIGGIPATITGTAGTGTNTITFTTTETIIFGNVLTIDYSESTGNCISAATSAPMVDVTAQSTLNNVGFADVTAPVLTSLIIADVARDRIVATYGEALDEGSVPATGDYTPNLSKVVDSVLVSGFTATVVMTTDYSEGDSATLSYTAGANPIQDVAGNDSVNLTTEAVTNNIPPAPSAPIINTKTVLLATPNDWVIVFNEPVTSTSAGWTLKIGGAGATISGTAGTGTTTITFTTTETPVSGDVLTLDYAPGSGDCLSVASSDELASITGGSVETIIAYTSGSIFDLSDVTVDGGGSNYTSSILMGNLQTVTVQNFVFPTGSSGRLYIDDPVSGKAPSSNVRITDCHWTGNSSEMPLGVNAWKVGDTNGFIVDNCTFIDNDIGTVIHLHNIDNVEFHQCSFTGNNATRVTHVGLIFMDRSNGSIHNCYGSDNYGNFVRFWGGPGSAVNDISDVIFINNRKYSFVEYNGNVATQGWDLNVDNCTTGDLLDDSVGPPIPDAVEYQSAGIVIYNPTGGWIVNFTNCDVFNTTVGNGDAPPAGNSTPGQMWGSDGAEPTSLAGSVNFTTRAAAGYTTDASVKLPDGREWWETGVDVTAPTVSSMTIEEATPTDIVMVFDEIVTGTNLGFTIAGTTSVVFSSISGSGTNTITGVLGTAAALGESPTLAYSSVSGDIVDASSNALVTFGATAITNNILAPTVVSMTVETAADKDIVIVFDEVVTGTNLGFTIGGTTSTSFASIAGSGTNTITGTLAVSMTSGETPTVAYSSTTGDIADTATPTNDLVTFGATAITNNISGVSTEVQAAYDNYTTHGDGLTNDEKTWMETYIDAEVANGNHAKKDYEAIFGLSGNNGKVDYIGGTVATLVASPTHGVTGYTLLRTSAKRINTNFNPTDGTPNFAQNDAQVEVFLKTYTTPANFSALFGNYNTPFIALFDTTDHLWGYLNQNGETQKSSYAYVDESLYSMVRSGSGAVDIYEDGVSIQSDTEASTGIDSSNILVGSFNETNHLDGIVSTCMIGAELANHTSHNTLLRALLTSIGTI